MKAAVYIRVSTEEQRERQTIATQREFAERYCKQNEIQVVGVYADDGVTGTIPLDQRPEGRRLLADAERRLFDTLLVYRIDRLGRDPLVILSTTKKLESLDVKLRSMTEPFDTSDPAGRFMFTMFSGFAGYERETFMQRSRDGTDRLVRTGAWLGGIVPYGYRAEGTKRERRLVVSEEPLPGLPFSEADVIRLIYRLATEEGKSCIAIAAHLKRLGVPPSYAKDGREVLRGKRRQATAGLWWPGRIRTILVSTTYKGIHIFGKRSSRPRELIERQVPAIVDPETWDKAQATLRKNRIQSPRNTRRKYLLRGLAHCGLCGLTYVGLASYGHKIYYLCNGKNHRGRFGVVGARCPSRAVPVDLEDIVWQDIEGFLRNPGPVIEELSQRLRERGCETKGLQKEADALERNLRGKNGERDAILGLYRRQRIDEASLDRQLDEIERERVDIQEALQGLQERILAAAETESHVQSAEGLLKALNERLDQPITWELKRQLVETLVDGIQVDTIDENGTREAVVTVNYRFTAPESHSSIGTRMGTGSLLRPGDRDPGQRDPRQAGGIE